jgi:cysteinyl-tRNA synthetase
MHTEFLLVEGEKMSKSKGNQFTVKDLVDEGYSPMAMRYLLLSVYYRQQLNFTREGLRQAETAIRRVDDLLDRLGEPRREARGVLVAASRALTASKRRWMDRTSPPRCVFDLMKEEHRLSSSSMTKGTRGP